MALALWLGLRTFGIVRWLSAPVLLLGLAMVWTGVQRQRFVRGGGGPGLVQVDERRVIYWGPQTGGVVNLGDLLRLEVAPGRPAARWLLTPLSGEPLAIPADAEGAEALFDAFAALPGLKVEPMLAALARPEGPPVAVWQAPNVVAFPAREKRRLR